MFGRFKTVRITHVKKDLGVVLLGAEGGMREPFLIVLLINKAMTTSNSKISMWILTWSRNGSYPVGIGWTVRSKCNEWLLLAAVHKQRPDHGKRVLFPVGKRKNIIVLLYRNSFIHFIVKRSEQTTEHDCKINSQAHKGSQYQRIQFID